MDVLAAALLSVADWITSHVTMWVLIATGLFLTVVTRGVQVRHLPDMLRAVAGSRTGAQGGISSFQAFAISLAARVGIGNFFGVAEPVFVGVNNPYLPADVPGDVWASVSPVTTTQEP